MAVSTVAEQTFEVLRGFGVDRAFGNPGSTEMHMFAYWPSDLDYVLALQEASVVAMADGYAQRSGRPGFVNVHTAAGLGNAMGAVVSAARNNTPLLITAGQQTRAMLPTDPYLCSPRSTLLPAPYVKWANEPARAADVPAAIARALLTALTPPRGPVFVSIPEDDWSRQTEAVPAHSVVPVLGADPDAIGRFARVLAAARRPAIVVGQAADASGAAAEIVTLAERLNASVYEAPQSSRFSFPQRHPLFQGFLAASRQKVVQALDGHDVILVIGAHVFTYHIHTEGPFLPAGAQLLHLTDDPALAFCAPVGQSAICSLHEGVRSLTALVSPTNSTPPSRWQRSDPGPLEAPFQAGALTHLLSELLPDNAVIFEEAPSYRDIIRTHLRMKTAGKYHNSFSGGLGWALPAAVGGSLADRDSTTVCIAGDGSMMYSIQALWTAAQHQLPLTVVVYNNAEYGAMKGFKTLFGINHFTDAIETALNLPGIDLVTLAQGLGVAATRADDPATLSDTLITALASPAPILIDVPVAALRGVGPV
jgi:benzoylformate decarboxylase